MEQKKDITLSEKDIKVELDRQEKEGFKEYNRIKEASERWQKEVAKITQKLALPQDQTKCEIYNCKNDWKVKKKLKGIKGKAKTFKICKHDSDFIENHKANGVIIGQLQMIENRLINISFVKKK